MTNPLADQLDAHIDALLAGRVPTNHSAVANSQFAPLLAAGNKLLHMPRPDFRARLRADLQKQIRTSSPDAALPALPPSELEAPRFDSLILPPPDRAHLAASFAVHVAALAGILTSGLWIVDHHRDVRQRLVSVLNDSSFVLAPSRNESHGGGGGGDHDKMPASKGTAPRFAQQQLTPPTAVIRNENPALPADPTLVGPPDVKFPVSSQSGDPLVNVLPPSNGTGSGGGIGSGLGGGIGEGTGPGLGPGEGGGIGGGIYVVGGGVSAPRAIFSPDPEYSEEARKAKYQGDVVLEAIIAPDGRPRELRVARSLGMGLDEKAVEAVRTWRFAPALKDGHAVAVRVAIEVAFRLY
jgi:TonB family protein